MIDDRVGEMEDNVLGAILLRNEAFHEVAGTLARVRWSTALRERIWAAIVDLMGRGDPCDAVTLMDALPEHADVVMDLATNTASAANVKAYAERVRGYWQMREAVNIAQRLISESIGREEGAIDRAITELMGLDILEEKSEFTGSEVLKLAFLTAKQAWENGGKITGITSGLSDLDDVLGGWLDSDLTVIGGRPRMGKTALLLSFAEAAAASGKRVGVISAEQPAVQLGIRRASMNSGVPATSIQAGKIEDEDWGKLQSGIASTKDRPIWVYDRSAITLDELISVARRWKHNHKIDILMVDYAQRIKVPRADRIAEVSAVAIGLKNIARSLNIPVVALAQVVKSVDGRDDKRPTMSDLANSDELVREADRIIMMYRDEVYNKNSQDKNIVELNIEKNRHGPEGYIRAFFDKNKMLFRDLDMGY